MTSNTPELRLKTAPNSCPEETSTDRLTTRTNMAIHDRNEGGCFTELGNAKLRQQVRFAFSSIHKYSITRSTAPQCWWTVHCAGYTQRVETSQTWLKPSGAKWLPLTQTNKIDRASWLMLVPRASSPASKESSSFNPAAFRLQP